MNPNKSIEFLQNQLDQYRANMAQNNPLSNHNMNTIPPMAPAVPPPLNQNETAQSALSNRTYSLIIEYWFRTTKPSTIDESDSHQPAKKENAINVIITDYCTPIFRTLPIPKEEHGYGSLPTGPSIYSTSQQFNTFINSIVTHSHYNNKEGVLNALLAPKHPINWDEEFVVIIVSHSGSPIDIKFKTDEYEINKDNNSLIVVLETNHRTDTGSCAVMAYYAWCVVVNKRRAFDKIGVKSRIVEVSVPQCTSILPTDDLSAINRKVRDHYANLTPNDYERKVYESINYKDINGAPNDPFGGLM